MTPALRPTSLDDLVAVLGANPEAVPVAGCTDFLVQLESGRRPRPPVVVDITRVPALRGVRVEGGWLDIGAAETFWDLRHDALVRRHAGALAVIAATIGAWQIQARATLGGNIANASPAGDALPVLLALDAQLVLAGPGGQRVVPYATFHRAYRRTALRPGELIARVRIPIRPGRRQVVRKVGTRRAQAISVVTVAASACLEGGLLVAPRFAAASVAPVPVRLLGAEAACERRRPDEDTAELAGRWAAQEVDPIDDVRATAAYRRWVLERVVRRLVLALADAGPPGASP